MQSGLGLLALTCLDQQLLHGLPWVFVLLLSLTPLFVHDHDR